MLERVVRVFRVDKKDARKIGGFISLFNPVVGGFFNVRAFF